MKMEGLINAVKKHRNLWDLSHPLYKDHIQRAESWAMVSEECGLPEESAKTKWKGLRDTYLKFLKGQKRASEQGRKKRKKYCYAETMAFMKTGLLNLNPRSQAPKNQTQEVYKIESIPHIMECEQKADTPTPEVSNQSFEDNTEYCDNNNVWQHTPADYSETDATDMLFLSYSKTLKTFSKRRQILLKKKIAELFSNAELEQLMEDEVAYNATNYTNPMEICENVHVRLHNGEEYKIEPQ